MISRFYQRGSIRGYVPIAVGLVAVLLVAAFGFLPRYEDQNRNAIAAPPAAIDPYAQEVHNSLFIADLHADSLLWQRNILERHNYGHVDQPRLLDGNVSLQVFSVVTKTPFNLNLYQNSDRTNTTTLLAVLQRWPLKTWTSLYARALYQADRLHRYEQSPDSELQSIRYREDLLDFLSQRSAGEHKVATILSLEGGHALEGKLENVDGLYAAGFRIIGFTHFFDNELGGSAHGLNKGGITPFGMQVLQRMEQLGMLVDIAHASDDLIDDIFAIATRPVISTHTGVKGLCGDSPRNLSDKNIRAIANSGGLIGIGFWPNAVCTDDAQGITDAILYVIELVGVDYVALGSDFDGNIQTPFDAAHLGLLTESLLDAGLTEAELRKVMGDNVQRLLLDVLPDKQKD